MARIYFFVGLLTICFPGIFCSQVLDEYETDIDEIGRSSLISPDELKLSFWAQPESKLFMNLTRNRNVRTDIPVWLSKDRHVSEWVYSRNMQYHSYYVSIEHKASILMKASPRADGSVLRKYSGWFTLDEKNYELEPVEVAIYKRKKRDASEQTGFQTSRGAYVVKPVEQRYEDLYPDLTRMREINPFEDETYKLGFASAQDNIDQEGKLHYYAELLIVVDFSTFQRMWDMGTAIRPVDRERETIENIKYYFSHVVNGIDLRYRTLDNEQYSINVRLVGLYISKTPRDSPWTEVGKEYEDGWSNAFIDAYTALDDFEAWLNRTKAGLPNFDHAALVTSHQLFGNRRSDGTHRRISGLSDIKGVCTYWRASINQDRGPFALTLTVTHELGHSFGAYHDGSQNTCSSSDQYIMASSPGMVTDENYLNVWRFSPCTITEFTKHLTFLNMMGMNCLVKTAFGHYDPDLVDYHLRTPPGQLFTIDEQCEYMHDTRSSFYCGGANNDRDICRVLECYHPDYRRCYSSVEQRAANGTSCGHKKWCILGDCVEDERAPSFLDYCWSGDYKGTFYDGRTCNQVVQESKWLCYDDRYRDACCERCESVRVKDNDVCPYGDRGEWCMDITRRDCYTKRVQDVCCETCDKLNTGMQECEFGDRASWCATMLPGLCYNNLETCCSTCEAYRRNSRNSPSCVFGDKASWCATVTAVQCYSIESTCCNTCKRFETGLLGCPYGDRGGSLCHKAVDCRHPFFQFMCCCKCSLFINLGHAIWRPLASSSARIMQLQESAAITSSEAQGCKYGNVGASCDGADCTDPYWANRCCKECYAYLDLSDLSTTSTRRWSPPTTPAPTTSTTTRSTTSTTERATTATPSPSRPSSTTPEYAGPGNADGFNHRCEIDKAEWCRDLPSSRCYFDNEICCETCPDQYTGIEGCEFGDHASWCGFIFRGNCYGELYQRQCCDTCPRLIDLTAPADCMWGNRYTWCAEIRPDECEDEEKRHACCETCDNFLRETTTTTTSPTTTTSTTTPTTTSTTTTRTTTTTTTTTTEIVPVDGCFGEDASWCNNSLPASYCYTVEESCCRACKAFWKDVPGCEYGDHFTWCKKLTSFQCKDDYYKTECCEQCAQFATTTTTTTPEPEETTVLLFKEETTIDDVTTENITINPTPVFYWPWSACEDEAGWCSTVHAGQCYSVEDICCHTCALVQSNVQGCEYGDHYATCETLERRECYFRSYRDSCCSTCGLLRSDNPACPWGDRYMDCNGADCTDPKIREYCCETCNEEAVTQVTTTLSPISPDCTDDATWCPTIPSRDCYVSDHVCCRTCVGHYTGLPSCIYGDEVSWCSNVIFTVEDCSKPTIGPYCCRTCASISLRSGYGWVPEPDSEVYEGALIVLQATTVDEMLDREPKLLELLSVYLDEYCSIEVQECCGMALLDERKPPLHYSKRRHRYFQKTHCHIGAGYPRKVNSLDVITKVLARIPLEYIDTMCMKSRTKWKRGVKARSQIFYVDKHLIYDILTQNQLVFEQKIRLEISRVAPAEPTEIEPETKSTNWALIISIIAIIGVLLLMVIVVVIVCNRRKRRKENDAARNLERSTSTTSTANLYQSNAYQWLAEQREAERIERERQKTLERARILEELIHERAQEKAKAIETAMPSVHFNNTPRSGIEAMDTVSYEHISIQKPD